MLWVQIMFYMAVVVFVLATVLRIKKYATTPIHLRWELYPVSHEAEKKKYGGSYFEEVEWWKNKNKKSLVSELTAMAEEILLLKGVYHHNRSLWYASYPFHLGLYLLVGLIGLLVVGGLSEMIGISVDGASSSLIGKAIFYATILAGYSGLTLALVGCVGLLAKRLNDRSLRMMTTPADFCNLGYILLLLACSLLVWLFADQTFAASREVVQSLLRFETLESAPVPVVLQLLLFSLFLLYMPFTRMTHFFAKYFTYHKVRWEDTPNLPGGEMESKIGEVLNFGVSWGAPHIQTGESWATVATNLPKEEKA